MAFVSETTRIETGSVSNFFSEAIENVKLMVVRRRVYRETYAELSALSERDLADIGLSSLMIRDLALEAARQV